MKFTATVENSNKHFHRTFRSGLHSFKPKDARGSHTDRMAMKMAAKSHAADREALKFVTTVVTAGACFGMYV
jgi:hypothetical protein